MSNVRNTKTYKELLELVRIIMNSFGIASNYLRNRYGDIKEIAGEPASWLPSQPTDLFKSNLVHSEQQIVKCEEKQKVATDVLISSQDRCWT